MQEYSDFVIEVVGQHADGTFKMKARTEHQGEVEDVLRLPFEFEDIENDLLEAFSLQNGVNHDRKAEISKRLDDIGERLASAVFTDKILGLFNPVRAREDGQVRIRLKYSPAKKENRRVSRLPWELMRLKNTVRPIVLNNQTPFCRLMQQESDLIEQTQPSALRILVVVADPDSPNLERFGGDAMKQQFKRLATQHVGIEVLKNATLDAMQDALREASFENNAYHAIQFLGHGDFDDASGSFGLCFENEEGAAVFVPSQQFVQNIPNDKNLRFVSLMSCNSSTMKASSDFDPFEGIAETLTQAGIPAVLGTQFAISVDGAFDFLEKFYNRILKNQPIDQAICDARIALRNNKESSPYEWMIPTLYMRSTNGQLFQPAQQTVLHINSILGSIKRRDVKNDRDDDDFCFLDVADYFEGTGTKSNKIADPKGWQEIYKEINDERLAMERERRKWLLLEGKSRLSIWCATGFIFRDSAGFRLSLQQYNGKTKRSETWTDEVVRPRDVLDVSTRLGAHPDPELVFAATFRDPIAKEVIHSLSQHGIKFNRMISMAPPAEATETFALRNQDDASAAIAQLEQVLKNEVRSEETARVRKIHLFLNCPAAIACFLMARMNAMPPIQIYEFVPGEGYFPSILLQ